MAERYAFSPILEREQFDEALVYVEDRVSALARKILGTQLPLDTLTLFAHFDDEHRFLEKIVRSLGSVSETSHNTTLYVDVNAYLDVNGNRIKKVGVRRPDPDRPQVGYGDFPVSTSGYDAYRALQADTAEIREIQSIGGKDLLELRRPDFDVLGYIVRAHDHE